MKTMVIMIGIQASGKSTFAKRKLSNYTRINLDTLNTRNKELMEFERALEAGENIVIDNTNPKASDRERYIPRAKEHGYKVVCYFMQSRVKDCVERNENRVGKAKVNTKAIAATSNKLEMPEYAEGFDEIYYVRISDKGFVIDEWR